MLPWRLELVDYWDVSGARYRDPIRNRFSTAMRQAGFEPTTFGSGGRVGRRYATPANVVSAG